MAKRLELYAAGLVLISGLIALLVVAQRSGTGAPANELLLLFILCFSFTFQSAITVVIVGYFFVLMVAGIFATASEMALLYRSPAKADRRQTRLTLLKEELEYITGDLYEEFSQHPTRSEAYVWLVFQIITSVLPILCNALRSRVTRRSG